ncbi:MAG: hypothetical protein D6734_10955 [Candidatus Schekmanbacteria bacterium]|nr:MAG: hypothetical protein D6734_10955 [Candidatus Schekmanbacteria bacterium]
METINNQYEEDEINLLDYWRVIVKHKKFIRNLFFASVILTAIVSLIMTKIYRAQTTIMPVSSSASQGLAAQLSSIPFAGAFLGSAATSNPLNKIYNVLKSRSVSEAVINSLELKKVFFEDEWDEEEQRWEDEEPYMEDTIKKLNKIISISRDIKSGLITITVTYKDPELCAKIANQFTKELQKALNEKTFTVAKKNRIEIEKELNKTKTKLKDAEERLAKFQENSKVLSLDAQTEALIKALAELKAKLVSKQIELGVMKKFATEKNPEVLKLKDEISQLKKQIDEIESGIKDKTAGKGKDADSVFQPLTEAPDTGLQYIRLKRDMMIYEKIYELLSQQHEIAKIDENKESVDFVIIDEAKVPERRYKPKRTVMVLIAGISSLFIGVFMSFLLEYVERSRTQQ